jgi:hypothetical protein
MRRCEKMRFVSERITFRKGRIDGEMELEG